MRLSDQVKRFSTFGMTVLLSLVIVTVVMVGGGAIMVWMMIILCGTSCILVSCLLRRSRTPPWMSHGMAANRVAPINTISGQNVASGNDLLHPPRTVLVEPPPPDLPPCYDAVVAQELKPPAYATLQNLHSEDNAPTLPL